MTHFSLEQYWERVEQQVQRVSQALATGDAAELLESSSALQQLSVALVDFLDENSREALFAPAAMQRMQELVSRIPALREVLLRRNAQVDLALQILVPTAPQAATYGADSTRTGAFYGAIPRKSGTFQATSA